MWKTFHVFYGVYPKAYKGFAIAFLFLPSVMFWGGGVLKDSLCIGFLGWLFYASFHFFIKGEWKARFLIISIVSGYCLGTLKIYIMVIFLIVFVGWYLIVLIRKIHNPILKTSIIGGIIFFGGLFMYIDSDFIFENMQYFAVDNIVEHIEGYKKMYEKFSGDEGALISTGNIDPTPAGILRNIPFATGTTLFRPFLWESKKIVTLLSGLENLFILLFTIYILVQTKIYGFFKIIFQNGLAGFCFFFSTFFAAMIGLLTYNFGTLVRYKIPCMPFFIAALIIILHIHKENKLTQTKSKN